MLDDSLHEARVEVLNKYANEGHLLAGILEDHIRVVRLATQAVRSHHHRQVARVHLGHSGILGRSEHLHMIWCNSKKARNADELIHAILLQLEIFRF